MAGLPRFGIPQRPAFQGSEQGGQAQREGLEAQTGYPAQEVPAGEVSVETMELVKSVALSGGDAE